jgi:hypothetical protein
MTITLNLTPEQEARLAARAQAAGVSDPTEYLLKLIDTPEANGANGFSSTDMADHLRSIGVLGAVEGTPRSDGRPWSEIEAACDSH